METQEVVYFGLSVGVSPIFILVGLLIVAAVVFWTGSDNSGEADSDVHKFDQEEAQKTGRRYLAALEMQPNSCLLWNSYKRGVQLIGK